MNLWVWQVVLARLSIVGTLVIEIRFVVEICAVNGFGG